MELIDIYLNSQSHKIISLDKSRGMLSHAYMIECLDKWLSEELGIFVSKEIFCTSTQSPCCECINCNKIEHGNMVDLKIYPKEKNIMVDDVVEIVSDAIQRPMDNVYKIYVLKNFDLATIQAQNKILKTLEEPPYNVIFILTCSNSTAVLPTIISRVKKICEPLLDINVVESFLKDKNILDYENVAKISGGNIDNAFKIANASNAGKIVDIAFDTLINLKTSADVLKFNSKIMGYKKDFRFFIDTLISILRDASVFNCKDIIYYSDRMKDLERILSLYSKKAIEEIMLNLSQIHNKLDFNCNLVGVIDRMLLDILEVKFLCQK